jgi:hypothetical protein
MQIRPRRLSGVLFSVFNSQLDAAGGDYLVLQIVDGDVVFNMDNGRGDVTSKYSPPAKNELCNGLWHTIVASKSKNVVTLTVDGINAGPGIGDEGFSATDTSHPAYIGGVPAQHRGIRATEPYVGCIRKLELEKKPRSLSSGRAVGPVNLNLCPTT